MIYVCVQSHRLPLYPEVTISWCTGASSLRPNFLSVLPAAMAEPTSPWKGEDLSGLASSSTTWGNPLWAPSSPPASPPKSPAGEGEDVDDGMGLLRGSILDIDKPFKCALDCGKVRMCVEFRQGFQGAGAEKYETGAPKTLSAGTSRVPSSCDFYRFECVL